MLCSSMTAFRSGVLLCACSLASCYHKTNYNAIPTLRTAEEGMQPCLVMLRISDPTMMMQPPLHLLLHIHARLARMYSCLQQAYSFALEPTYFPPPPPPPPRIFLPTYLLAYSCHLTSSHILAHLPPRHILAHLHPRIFLPTYPLGIFLPTYLLAYSCPLTPSHILAHLPPRIFLSTYPLAYSCPLTPSHILAHLPPRHILVHLPPRHILVHLPPRIFLPKSTAFNAVTQA